MIASEIRRFWRRREGNVAYFLALALIPLAMLAGGVVDATKYYSDKAKLQSALDNALLAVAAGTRLPPSDKEELRKYKSAFKRRLRAWFDRNLATQGVGQSQIGAIRLRFTATSVDATVEGRSRTTFLRLAALENMKFTVRAQVSRSSGFTEIVLVLDNTGSMRWDLDKSRPAAGSKLAALKRAAKKMLDDLYRMSEASGDRVKVGIVPFSRTVKVGREKANASWLGGRRKRRCGGRRCRGRNWDGSVGVRAAPHDSEDGGYTLHKIPIMNSGLPLQPIAPLTLLTAQNVKLLKEKINAMQASGGTNIPVGLVWGWRVLSHEPPYTEGASDADIRNRKINKVIILLTDGLNSCGRARNDSERPTCYPDPVSPAIRRAGNEKLLALCKKIRKINSATKRPYAEVATLGLGLDSIAGTWGYTQNDVKSMKETLKNCASLGFYDVQGQNGNLVQAFSTIAGKIMKMHLSK